MFVFKDKYFVSSGYELTTVIVSLIILIYIIIKMYKKRNEPILKYYDVYSYGFTVLTTLCGSFIMIFIYLAINLYKRHKINTIFGCCE